MILWELCYIIANNHRYLRMHRDFQNSKNVFLFFSRMTKYPQLSSSSISNDLKNFLKDSSTDDQVHDLIIKVDNNMFLFCLSEN